MGLTEVRSVGVSSDTPTQSLGCGPFCTHAVPFQGARAQSAVQSTAFVGHVHDFFHDQAALLDLAGARTGQDSRCVVYRIINWTLF